MDGVTFKNVKKLADTKVAIGSWTNAFYIDAEVYLFGSDDWRRKDVILVQKYSVAENKWEKISGPYQHSRGYCICALMDKVYVIGGNINYGGSKESCVGFSTKTHKWTKLEWMIEVTDCAACSLFEGRIVVSGGFPLGRVPETKTVTEYDHVADAWRRMPNMNSGKAIHQQVTVGSKLFVFGWKVDNEVFDRFSNRFQVIKPHPECLKEVCLTLPRVVCVGRKIFFFGFKSKSMGEYDVEKDDWTKRPFEATSDIIGYDIFKIPRLL